jgi:DNA repair exonuclease SbcCD ATPase subunit
MNLTFKSIRILRFRSFLQEAVLSFDDMGSGLYFLKGKNKSDVALGSNGSGKSSVIDALMWCLYGKTVQGLKNPDIIPWSGKGKTEVEVTIFVDKTQHSIKRTVNPNLLTIDDKEAGQEYVNKLIGIPFEIIPYTIIVGQRQPLFFDLTASEKLKLFSEVLDLDRWEERSNHASELVKNLEREILLAELEVASLENAQSQALADLNALKQQSSQWEQQRAEQLSNAESKRSDLQKQIDSVMTERDSADLQLDRALTELKAIKPALEKLHGKERNLSIAVTNLLKDEKQATSKIEELEKMMRSFWDDTCPTCKQPLRSQQQKLELEKSIKKQIKQLDLAGVQDALAEACTSYASYERELEVQEKAKEQFEHEAEEARDILDRLQPKIANWQAEIKALDKAASENAEQDNPYQAQIQTLRRRKDQNKEAIEQAKKTIVTKTEYCERARFWVKGFKDIKLLQVEEILQELDITTNALCEQFGLFNWQVKYDIERETKSKTIARGLNITVLTPHNKNAVKWESWSGGEAQRLRLIGTLALGGVLMNHIGVTTNLAIFDEPTESLSREGVQDLVELLAAYAKDSKKSVWMVDHHLIESSHFIQTVLVTKDKGGSTISIS